MEAYNGESNAHAKYLAYAKKAEEEGVHAGRQPVSGRRREPRRSTPETTPR